jgi:hypothetical protein
MKEILEFEIGDVFLKKAYKSEYYKIYTLTGILTDLDGQKYYNFDGGNGICYSLKYVKENLIPVRDWTFS